MWVLEHGENQHISSVFPNTPLRQLFRFCIDKISSFLKERQANSFINMWEDF